MTATTVGSTPASSDSSKTAQTAANSAPAAWSVGMNCRARYPLDGQLYPAKIVGMVRSDVVTVIYDGYEDEAATRLFVNHLFPLS
eukprot:m.94097 g.94097  ORF g.94097 m.94097 type:complete len:85 (+) comp51224_c0_seq1:767-1021(+)